MIKVNYKQFMKHAEKVAKSASNARPILKGVNHSDNGTLTVTDSRRIYQAHNVNAPKNVILDAITGDEITAGNYPKVADIIPNDSDADKTYAIDTKELKAVLKAMQPVGRVDGTKTTDIEIKLFDDSLQLVNKAGIDFSYNIGEPLGHNETETNLLFNMEFLLEAVELMDDIKAPEIEIRYYGNLRPFTIKPVGSNEIVALIMPMRPTNNNK